MPCPRCGHAGDSGPSCPACGVVFAKVRERRHARPRHEAMAQSHSSSATALVLAALVGFGGFVAWRVTRPRTPPAAPAPAGSPAAPAAAAPAGAPEITLPPAVLPGPSPVAPVAPEKAAGLTPAELQQANALAALVNRSLDVAPSDVAAAEELYLHHPQEQGLRDLLVAVLMQRAGQERKQRRFTEAATVLRRAALIDGSALPPRTVLVQVLLEGGLWSEAEQAARELIQLSPRDVRAMQALALALVRQDRAREAADVLRAALEIADDEATRALLAQVEHNLRAEHGMVEQRLSHFHVRYEGEEHEDVGREILRALERHWSTLVRTLDVEPQNPVPVVLFTREQYFQASGAPAWSGGVYDSSDGRIRVPIGGLTTQLTREIDETLLHELTHAFLAEATKNAIQQASDVNEGIAQYMEGRRAGLDMDAREFAAVMEGIRVARPGQCGSGTCVHGFYQGALSFVEHLVALRGQGGLNELIAAMGETGSRDEAFRRAYGQDHAGMRRAWLERLKQRQ